MGAGTVRRAAVILLSVGALCAGAGVVALAPEAARAAPAPVFTLEFGELSPGVPESRSGTFVLDRDADLTGFAWLERDGLMQETTLVALVCDSAGTCVNPEADTGTNFSQGTVEVTVTAELSGIPSPATTGSVVGQLTFIADDSGLGAGDTDEGLPGTGSTVLTWLAIATAALATGALLVAVVRRRDKDTRDRPV